MQVTPVKTRESEQQRKLGEAALHKASSYRSGYAAGYMAGKRATLRALSKTIMELERSDDVARLQPESV